MCLFFAEWMHISLGSCFYNEYLYQCMIESSVNGKVSWKSRLAHSLSGMLRLWGACPSCTLNRITKLGPVHMIWHMLPTNTKYSMTIPKWFWRYKGFAFYCTNQKGCNLKFLFGSLGYQTKYLSTYECRNKNLHYQ